MSLNREITKRLFESAQSPESSLHETVVVGGNWYWKSKGTCWTQPTDKSAPRQEISEEDYRKACSSAKNGVTEIPAKKETPKEDPKKESPKSSDVTSRKDYFDVGNFYRIGRSGNFEKDMDFAKKLESGVTAELVYGDKTREYVRKVGPNQWKSDTGKKFTDNDIISVAYDDGKATINYMNKEKNRQGKSASSKSTEVVKNPESPKRLNTQKVSKEVATLLSGMGADHFDGSTYEFDKGVKAKNLALDMSNHLRKQGYKTQFWTPSGKASDTPTSHFSVEDPKDQYRSFDFTITPNKENSSDGKVYYDIDTEDVY